MTDLERQLAAVTAENAELEGAIELVGKELQRVTTERDALIDAAKLAIPASEHPLEKTTSNWAWQIRNLGDDRRAIYAQRDALQESNRQESAAMALLLERECQDGDKLAEALGVPRTEGGSLQVQRMLNVIDALRVDAERYKIARSWGVNVYRRGGERAKPNE